MNPDACKDVMDRSRIPYEIAQDVPPRPAYHTSLDELSMRKQLPLRQQADKPVLKYNTSLTKAVHLFNPEETLGYKKDVPGNGINAYSSSGMYFTGNLGISSSSNIQENASMRPNGGPPQNATYVQNKLRKIPSPTNPYVRPVSAKEIAANINGEKSKRMIESVVSVANIEKSSVPGSTNTTFQRNSFLRPLSGVAVKDKARQSASSCSSQQSKSSEDSVSLGRQNSSGSDSSSRQGENKLLKDTMFQFASTTSAPKNANLHSKQSSAAASTGGKASKPPISQSQSSKFSSQNNLNKPYMETVSVITKGPKGEGCITSHTSTSKGHDASSHLGYMASGPVIQDPQYSPQYILNPVGSNNSGKIYKLYCLKKKKK